MAFLKQILESALNLMNPMEKITTMQLRESIRNVLDRNDTTISRGINLFIQSIIIISIISFCVDTLPALDVSTRTLLDVIEVVCIGLFTTEYILRVYAAENRPGYVFSFFGLVDVIAILPFYISMGVDLRALRILRMLRLFRLFKLARYNSAMARFYKAFMLAKEEMILFGVITLMLLFLSSVGIYYFEHDAQPDKFKSIFHSLWWSVATLTTVGYGDVFPITIGGRIFTFVILMLGLGIVAVPAGLLASAFSRIKLELGE